LCRFVSVDPIAEDFPQLSSYNYASNRPETARDLEGLQASDQEAGNPNKETTNNSNGTAKSVGNESNGSDTKNNILIYIDSDSNVSRDKLEDDKGDNGTFYQIIAPDLASANSQLKKYLGGNTIENLVIRVHGASGALELDSGQNAISYKSIESFNSSGTVNYKNDEAQQNANSQLEALKEMSQYVSDFGNSVISGCQAGSNDMTMKGYHLGEALRELTGDTLNIYLNQDSSERRYDDAWIDTTKYFEVNGVKYPEKGTEGGYYDRDIRITGPLTPDFLYKEGWVRISPGKPQLQLKGNEGRGIVHLNAYKNQKPLTVK